MRWKYIKNVGNKRNLINNLEWMCNSLWSVLLTSVLERKQRYTNHTHTNTTPCTTYATKQSFLCWKHTNNKERKKVQMMWKMKRKIKDAYSESGKYKHIHKVNQPGMQIRKKQEKKKSNIFIFWYLHVKSAAAKRWQSESKCSTLKQWNVKVTARWKRNAKNAI